MSDALLVGRRPCRGLDIVGCIRASRRVDELRPDVLPVVGVEVATCNEPLRFLLDGNAKSRSKDRANAERLSHVAKSRPAGETKPSLFLKGHLAEQGFELVHDHRLPMGKHKSNTPRLFTLG